MNDHATLSRKEFLNLSAKFGAGLVIGFHLPLKQLMGQGDAPLAFEPNVWISINRDGTTNIVMHRCEMGQKIVTTLPMIVAEELDADWSMVRVVRANYDPAYGPQNTGGSASIRTTYDKLRKAGAAAREMLITAAAQTWNVPRSQCRTENGQVVHKGNGKLLSYGDLVTTASTLNIPEDVPLKNPADFSIIGTDNIQSKDGRIKVNGHIHYGLDFTMEGMLTSVIARCPVFGGQPKRWNQKAALAVSGVRHAVQVSAGIAVVADDTWSALQGRKALNVEWDEGPNAALSSEEISRRFREQANSKGEVLRDDGDVSRALKETRRTVKAIYELPYVDHAPMEPMNCSAHVHDGICEVWAPTQTPGDAHEVAREITGLPGDKVKINILYIGGGFGRRLRTDFVRDAVEVAIKVPAPVKVMRTRGEDLQHGFYRPASYHVLRGGIGRKKSAVAWSHRLVYPEDAWVTGGAADINYAIPNVHVDHHPMDIPVPVGAFRSVAHTATGFVNESFIDELAHTAGADPYQFRRKLMESVNPRLTAVMDAVAKHIGWGQARTGRGQGIAAHYSFHSYAATAAEVSVDKSGRYTIHRLVAGIDCGRIINPDGIRAQMEGGVTLALTKAIHGAITIRNGRVEQSNFHNYKLLGINEMPEVEVVLIPSDEAPTGVGEPGVPPTAPALTNAIFAVSGVRIRRLPIGKVATEG